MLTAHAVNLRRLLGTNPSCRRLGAWPASRYEAVRSPDFPGLDWDRARERLAALKLSKYCDFNLKNIAHRVRSKHTFEVRILPGHIEAEPILAAACLFEAILRRAMDGPPVLPRPGASWGETRRFIESLALDLSLREHWLERLSSQLSPQ